MLLPWNKCNHFVTCQRILLTLNSMKASQIDTIEFNCYDMLNTEYSYYLAYSIIQHYYGFNM